MLTSTFLGDLTTEMVAMTDDSVIVAKVAEVPGHGHD